MFLARSDPALNYGMVAAELVLKVGLRRLYELEGKLGSAHVSHHRRRLRALPGPPYPPINIPRALAEYPSAHTFTTQSAFKYDYDEDTVRKGIRQISAHERGEPAPIDEERAIEVIEKATAGYQEQVQKLLRAISTVSNHIPRRRDRRMHVGLFGYGRSMEGVEGVTLPSRHQVYGFALLARSTRRSCWDWQPWTRPTWPLFARYTPVWTATYAPRCALQTSDS